MIRIGNAPVSWGVFEADPPSRPNPPYARVLDAIAATGYEGTELGPYGYLPTEPLALAAALDARKLALASSFVPVVLEDPAAREAAVKTALTVGRLLHTRGVTEVILAGDERPARQRIAGRVPADGSAGLDDAGWKELARTVHAIARALRDELRMTIVLHHHAGTFVETPAEIDRFMAETDPDLVGLLLDTGHLVYGGGDPVETIRRYGARVRYVHLKDADRAELERVRTTDIDMDTAWRRGVFCALGAGVVDIPRTVEALRGIGYAGWAIVEQDVVPNTEGVLDPEPSGSARESRAYLRTLGL